MLKRSIKYKKSIKLQLSKLR